MSEPQSIFGMTLHHHDVVIVRQSEANQDAEIQLGRTLSMELRRRGMRNLVIVLSDGASIEALDAECMARHGWFRRATKREDR